MFFRRRKQQEVLEAKEQAIQAIREETFKKADSATKNTKQLNTLLDQDGGATQLILMAAGGDRRSRK